MAGMRRATVRAILSTALVVSCTGAWTAMSAAAEPKAPEKYTTFCAACHGPAGKGDGPAAAALNPKPRNFADGKYMNGRTDAQLINVIKNGGQPEKLSPLMTAFGNVLSDKEIKGIVAYIRSRAVPKFQPKQ